MSVELELLAPAKNLECGKAAIDCGADAVYIGSQEFGARSAAGNSLDDIKELTEYAHIYRSKVFVTINTILYDSDIERAEALIHELYNIGVDAIIIQDMAIMEMKLPPVAIHASTQTHNTDINKIKFFDQKGLQRAVLARELSIDNIKEISANTDIELEYFIHGALCVSYSGQCYMSHHIGKRSANRGECGQPCRLKYSMTDSNDETVIPESHLLSLKDLNNTKNIEELALAGIKSFKIEGRLKDISYVKNVTSWYRKQLDLVIAKHPKFIKASSGVSAVGFEPDPEKSFNRGFTDYFANNRTKHIASPKTPKSKGEYIGKVTTVKKDHFIIDTDKNLANGDGLCFFNKKGELEGIKVNRSNKSKIYPNRQPQLRVGTEIYRNFNHEFDKTLKNATTVRKIDVKLAVSVSQNSITATVADEDNTLISHSKEISYNAVNNPERLKNQLETQFSKTGGTPYNVSDIIVEEPLNTFVTASVMNQLRREILESLTIRRIKNNRPDDYKLSELKPDYPEKMLMFNGNVTNSMAEQFYNNHNTAIAERGFELLKNSDNKVVMTTKHCLKFMANICPKYQKPNKVYKEPMYISNNKERFRLQFNCKECNMQIITTK
ncbi:MAG: U32 family peptidase [Bacteroidales bacterium]|jgi:putative protease|nr:U32 family peptidase [Bacteroidales bacterium]